VVVMLRKALVALMITLLTAGALSRPSLAQDASQPQTDRIIVPQGETELRFDNIERVPRQLLAAIRRTGYRVEDWLPHIPVRIIGLAPRAPLIALVPCGSIVAFSEAFLLGRGWQGEPRLLSFPVIAFPSGFGVTTLPGFLEWNGETKTMTATQGTDIGSAPVIRYTYQYGSTSRNADLDFALVRAEIGSRARSVSPEWKTYWEAVPWASPLPLN
jgi:hypothetical protein